MPKIFHARDIAAAIEPMLVRANFELPSTVHKLLAKTRLQEHNRLPRYALDCILQNADIAYAEHIPLCQDTGLVQVFVTIGCNAAIYGSLQREIDSVVSTVYQEHFLRKSIVAHPLFERCNTQTNTPSSIFISQSDDTLFEEHIRIDILIKGGGAENKSVLSMLTPSAGVEGIVDFVVQTVIHSGADACPPLFLGVGIGGDFASVALAAKRALLLEPDENNSDSRIAELERVIVERANALGGGVQGLGGVFTVIAARIITLPCHIASLPVAVNVCCHSHRHAHVIL